MHPPPHLPMARIRNQLRYVIARSRLTQGAVEHKLGFSKGHVSQLLTGAVELKIWHVEAILDCLEIDPGAFFDELFPHPRHWPCGLPPDLEAELAAKGKLLPVLLAILYGFGIEVIQGEHRRMTELENRLVDLALEVGEDVTL